MRAVQQQSSDRSLLKRHKQPANQPALTQPGLPPQLDEEADRRFETLPPRSMFDKQMRKTRLCHFYLNGMCKYGSKCNFAHDEQELQNAPDLRKTRVCKAFLNGGCSNRACNFAHGQEELRATELCFKTTLCMWHAKGKCVNGSRCRFAHGHEELRRGGHDPVPKEAERQVARSPGTGGSMRNPQALQQSRLDELASSESHKAGQSLVPGAPFPQWPGGCLTGGGAAHGLPPWPNSGGVGTVGLEELTALYLQQNARLQQLQRLSMQQQFVGMPVYTGSVPGSVLEPKTVNPQATAPGFSPAATSSLLGALQPETHNDLLQMLTGLSAQIQRLKEKMQAMAVATDAGIRAPPDITVPCHLALRQRLD
mmetsp:Transcript_39432/g.91456  ORF Transcript_39432/g.91456 Transcript_39432/m.91456 type:complete len:367 (-) Transcript_39432:173-1273(-)